jgi:PIN domain nuclease of toxin-antitoxin system
MKLLLDTHIWIWALNQPQRLSHKVRRALEKPGNELYLSPVSIWEASHLARRGRLRLRQSFDSWLQEVFTRVPLREAPFTLAVAANAAMIELPQPDPGHVFLAATAITLGLTLVTGDEQLVRCAGLSVLVNE